MADEVVKTLHIFSRIETDQNATIKRIKVGKRREVVLVSSGDEFLHFLESEKLLQTVRLPARFLWAEFCSCDGEKLILALSKDGKVWVVLIPEKKSKKSKSNQASTAFGGSQGSKSSDQDIFSGLLTESGRSLSANTSANQQNLKDRNSSVVNVTPESFIIFEPNAECVLFIDGNIVTSGWSESGVTISFYVKAEMKAQKLAYPALPTFRTTIPIPDQPNAIFHESSSDNLMCRHTEHPKMSLLCIFPKEGSHGCCSLHAAYLQNGLFGQLFGREALLLSSPILLIGCGNGQIYFTPLSFYQAERMVLQQQLNTPTSEENRAPFFPKLLYDLEQDLVGIHLVSLPSERKDRATAITNPTGGRSTGVKETGKASTSAILFVGSGGKLVLAEENHSDNAAEFGVTFSVFNVPAPVLCSCVDSSSIALVYSTGKEIFVTKLHPETTTTSCVPQSLPSGLTPKCIVLPNVCAMNSGVKLQRHKSEAGINEGDQVLALTFGGRLLDFRLLMQDGEEASEQHQGTALHSMTPELAARKVRDALINIEEVSKQMSKVELVIEAEDEILKEVNIAMNIICDSMAGSVGFGSNQRGLQAGISEPPNTPIACSFTPQIRLPYGPQSLAVLQCNFTNQSRHCFSHHWQLLIQLHGCKPWLSAVEDHYITVSHTVSLGQFSAGSTREINIPLDADFDVVYSVSVEVFLLCDLYPLLARLPIDPHKRAEFLHVPQNANGIIVPVMRTVFDALHLLRSQSVHQASSRVRTQGSMQKLSDTLKELNSVSQGLSFQDETRAVPRNTAGDLPRQQSHSVSFQLSQDCVDHIKVLATDISRGSLPANHTSPEPITDAASLFLFLLADSGLTPQQVGVGCSLVTMETVSGEPVTLCVRRFSDTSVGKSLVTGVVELSIRSPSMQLLSSVHEAVLTRLEQVVSRTGKQTSTPLHHIQKAAKQLEDVQKVSASLLARLNKRQHKSQMAIAHGEDEADFYLVSEVWQLYQRLRQVQLILP